MDKPTRQEAEQAVATLIKWIGDDIDRDGLKDTPKRVIEAYAEFFAGYKEDPAKMLKKKFENINNYKGMVLVKDIDFFSHCEHHLVPITGVAHVAYFPTDKVVGISKLSRVVDVFARRLQTQEFMTAEIANVIQEVLDPQGIAIYIDAKHMCMTTRGVKKENSSTVTSHFSGCFANPAQQSLFLEAIKKH